MKGFCLGQTSFCPSARHAVTPRRTRSSRSTRSTTAVLGAPHKRPEYIPCKIAKSRDRHRGRCDRTPYGLVRSNELRYLPRAPLELDSSVAALETRRNNKEHRNEQHASPLTQTPHQHVRIRPVKHVEAPPASPAQGVEPCRV